MIPALNNLITALLSVADFESTKQRTVHRLIHPVLNANMTIVISATEPSDEPFPMNVVWVDMDLTSNQYRTLRQRVSKTPAGGLNNTWRQVQTLSEVYEPQQYDPTDLPDNKIEVATDTKLGIARLTTAPKNVGNPIMVSTDDPRNYDARRPLAHSHPEVPARKFATRDNPVDIVAAPTIKGQTLVATSDVKATYDQVAKTGLLKENG